MWPRIRLDILQISQNQDHQLVENKLFWFMNRVIHCLYLYNKNHYIDTTKWDSAWVILVSIGIGRKLFEHDTFTVWNIETLWCVAGYL